ncbi:MAG: hypothetical protein ACRDLT_12130 [Solirubrobacteraceae bacterium]
MAVDERPDPVEVPSGLKAAGGVGLDDPAGVVGVNDAVPATLQFRQDRRLPVPDMPVTSTTDRSAAPSLCVGAGLPLMPVTA